MPNIAYGGLQYPVSTETLRKVVKRMRSFELRTETELFEIATSDGRYVVVNIGPAIPIALEGDSDSDLESK